MFHSQGYKSVSSSSSVSFAAAGAASSSGGASRYHQRKGSTSSSSSVTDISKEATKAASATAKDPLSSEPLLRPLSLSKLKEQQQQKRRSPNSTVPPNSEKKQTVRTPLLCLRVFSQCPFLHLLCFPSFILSLILRPTPLPNFPQRPRLLRRPGFPPPPPPVCASTSSRSTWSSGDSTLRPPPPPSSTPSACGLPRTRWCHSCHRRRRRSLELEHRTERILTVPRRG